MACVVKSVAPTPPVGAEVAAEARGRRVIDLKTVTRPLAPFAFDGASLRSCLAALLRQHGAHDLDEVDNARLETACACSAHPARFSPDDKYSRERLETKKRFGLLPTQRPAHEY